MRNNTKTINIVMTDELGARNDINKVFEDKTRAEQHARSLVSAGFYDSVWVKEVDLILAEEEMEE